MELTTDKVFWPGLNLDHQKWMNFLRPLTLMKKKLRIGIINPSDFSGQIWGGTSGFIKNIIQNINYHDITIFGVGLNGAKIWEIKHPFQNVKFIPISDLKYPSKIPMRLKCLLSYIINRNKILDFGVDVLYIHSPESCLPFLYQKKIPVIYHQHGSGNPVLFSKYKIGRSPLFRNVFNLISKIIFQKADWIIAIDNLCYQQAEMNNANYKTTLILNAVNTDEFNINTSLREIGRKHYKLEENEIALLYVGRIEKSKGPGRILECIPYLIEKNLKFHIFLAGDGNYLNELKTFLRNRNYQNFVTFLGYIAHEKLPLFYNMADAVVLPSDMEGVPMVILESLSCGTPAVASKVGGIPLVIKNNINGILIDEMSSQKISESILGALSLRTSREAISVGMQEFRSEEFVKKLEEIMNKIIATKLSN